MPSGVYVRTKKNKENISKAGKKRYQDPLEKEKNRKSTKEGWDNPKSKEKARISAIKRIERNNGYCYPNYNPKACDYFELFDAQHNTKGHFAMFGDGEYQIKELGYFVDYLNEDLKLIIEWDEKHHFENGVLRNKDVQRQKEIQKHYPDYEFFRIKEN